MKTPIFVCMKAQKQKKCMELLKVLLLLLFLSCGQNQQVRHPPLPSSKGLPCELLVVCDASLFRGALKDSILSLTEGQTPGLGSDESIFRTSNIGSRGYTPAFSVMHSQIFFRIDTTRDRPRWGVTYNLKAQPQIIIEVIAPNASLMQTFLGREREKIQQVIIDFQLNRLGRLLKQDYNKSIDKKMKSISGYGIYASKALIASKQAKDFLWWSTNRNLEDMNLLYFSYPWNGEPLGLESYIVHRDSVLRVNIPGSKPTQWMKTARGLGKRPAAMACLRNTAGGQRMEVRGLWELHGGFMGGPFVAHVRIDTVQQRVLAFEGFVYNPNGKKRDLMRHLEAMLTTVYFSKNQTLK